MGFMKVHEDYYWIIFIYTLSLSLSLSLFLVINLQSVLSLIAFFLFSFLSVLFGLFLWFL